MSRYLVTGGAGFIGAAVASSLLADGHEVVVLDNLSTGFREAVPKGAVFFEGACQDASVYDRLPAGPYEAIHHIAGQSSGEISFDDPVYDLQTNTQSTLLLLKFARKNGCRRFLYAGTMSVYGDQPDAPVSEDAPCVPKSFYGVGKLASEHYLRIHEQYGVRSTVLRLFNVYGPGQNLANLRQGMVSIYLAQALKSRSVLVKGGPDRFRDFVEIGDVVAAFRAVEGAEKTRGGVFNVCTGRRTTVRELLDLLLPPLPFKTEVRFDGSTPGDMHGITGDPSRLAAACGWKARTSLEDGLKRMTAWALDASR
ncbi:MAG: NAD-dependent epimerase/dehydratase family protein [Elusimicrobia bacterium]|nr:NAD-dependent epimerase/dehydratase family protein [Elusimicrobiota bacterium]